MPEIIPFVSRESAMEASDWVAALQAAMPEFSIRDIETLNRAEKESVRVALVANPDPQTLAALPNLAWVQSLWAGVERLVNELPDAPFSIVRLVDPQLADTMSEAVLAWTLYLHRDMPAYAAQQATHTWQPLPVSPAAERRVGVLGLGALGTSAAQRLAANGFDVAGWRRTSGAPVDGVTVFTGADGLRDILKRSDIVAVLLPLTPETRHLLSDDALSRLPMGASVINFARGAIIDDEALLKRLDSGHLDHAVLDVFAEEPLPPEHLYWSHPGVTVLPHISAPTNRRTASAIAAGNIRRYFEDGTMPETVDRARGY